MAKKVSIEDDILCLREASRVLGRLDLPGFEVRGFLDGDEDSWSLSAIVHIAANRLAEEIKKKPCPTCGGSGQVKEEE